VAPIHAPGQLGKPERLEAPVCGNRRLVLEREPNGHARESHRLLLVEDRGTHSVMVGGLGLRSEDDLKAMLTGLSAIAADVEAGGLP
jgi:hypothetical protein